MLQEKIALLHLQKAQNRHDAEFHPDILALGTIGRLKHMALHNAKYAARFASAQAERDDDLFSKTLTDSFIIGLSTANTLTQNLDDQIKAAQLASGHAPNRREFWFEYLQIVGRMAKACESIDHLEDYPFRPEISQANIALVKLVLDESLSRNFDLTSAYTDRIKNVEARSGFAMFSPDSLN